MHRCEPGVCEGETYFDQDAKACVAPPAAAQADQEQKSASGRGGVTWIRSARAGVSFTKSEVTVAQYEACVRAGTCSDYHLVGYYRRTPSCPSRDASRAA
jgi:hypothetical protein